MRQPGIEEFWHQAWAPARWRAELVRQFSGVHSRPCLVDLDGVPLAYLEIYRVRLDVLAGAYHPDPDDLGVHIAIGATEHRGRGLGTRLLSAVIDDLLQHCGRVVAEPDLRNSRSIQAFHRAGFISHGEIALPDKAAMLMIAGRPLWR